MKVCLECDNYTSYCSVLGKQAPMDTPTTTLISSLHWVYWMLTICQTVTWHLCIYLGVGVSMGHHGNVHIL